MSDFERYLSKKEVADWFGVCTRTIDAWLKNQRFPPPHRQPGGRPRWRETDLELVMQRGRTRH